MNDKDKKQREKRLKELDAICKKAMDDISKKKRAAVALEKRKKEIDKMIEDLEKDRKKNQEEIEEQRHGLESINETLIEPFSHDEEAGKELVGEIKELRGEVKAVPPKDPGVGALIAIGVLLPTFARWCKNKLDGVK
jgi:hypothetical protein